MSELLSFILKYLCSYLSNLPHVLRQVCNQWHISSDASLRHRWPSGVVQRTRPPNLARVLKVANGFMAKKRSGIYCDGQRREESLGLGGSESLEPSFGNRSLNFPALPE